MEACRIRAPAMAIDSMLSCSVHGSPSACARGCPSWLASAFRTQDWMTPNTSARVAPFRGSIVCSWRASSPLTRAPRRCSTLLGENAVLRGTAACRSSRSGCPSEGLINRKIRGCRTQVSDGRAARSGHRRTSRQKANATGKDGALAPCDGSTDRLAVSSCVFSRDRGIFAKPPHDIAKHVGKRKLRAA